MEIFDFMFVGLFISLDILAGNIGNNKVNINGGDDVTSKDPFFDTIVRVCYVKPSGKRFCGSGSVIGGTTVMVAKHEIESSESHEQYTNFIVNNIHGWTSVKLDMAGDIAFLTLDTDIPVFTRYQKLSNKDHRSRLDEDLIIVGGGRVSTCDEKELNITRTQFQKKAVKNQPWSRCPYRPTMMCTLGCNTRFGDSGGMVLYKTTEGEYLQVGVIAGSDDKHFDFHTPVFRYCLTIKELFNIDCVHEQDEAESLL